MSESFDATWLTLREPVDHRSRARELLDPLREWWAEGEHLRVLDLGCGTGSNLRYLAPWLPHAGVWTLVDHDAELLARAERYRTDATHGAGRAELEVRPIHGDVALEGLAEVEGSDLVTASALLDLVSEAWLTDLVHACADHRCGALFALSYTGDITWRGPAHPHDALVRDALNEHQRRDKGLGPALGPSAGATAARLFTAQGYRIWSAPSPWELGAADVKLVEALLRGWVDAVLELRPDDSAQVRRWADERLAGVTSGAVRLTVGHVDLLALPGPM